MSLPEKKTTAHVDIEVRSKLLYVKLLGPQVGQRESPIISQDVEPYMKATVLARWSLTKKRRRLSA